MCAETDINPDGCGVKKQNPTSSAGRRPSGGPPPMCAQWFLPKWEPQGLAGGPGLVSPPCHQLLPRRILTHNIRPWFPLGCTGSPPNECWVKQRVYQGKTAGSNVNSMWVSRNIVKFFYPKMIFFTVRWLVTDALAINSVALVGYWMTSGWLAVQHTLIRMLLSSKPTSTAIVY